MINKDFQSFLKKNKLNKKNNYIIETDYNTLSLQFENPEEFLENLKESLSSSTMIFPTFTISSINENDQFDLSMKPDDDEVYQKVVEDKESFRSVHPTHSFAIFGKDRAKYGAKQIKDRTPLGKKCPLASISNGKIVCFGELINNLAYIQYLEEYNKVPYLFNDNNLKTYFINNKAFKYKEYAKYSYGFSNNFIKILDLLKIKPVFFNNIPIYIIDIKELKNEFSKKIKENPYYFVVKKD